MRGAASGPVTCSLACSVPSMPVPGAKASIRERRRAATSSVRLLAAWSIVPLTPNRPTPRRNDAGSMAACATPAQTTGAQDDLDLAGRLRRGCDLPTYAASQIGADQRCQVFQTSHPQMAAAGRAGRRDREIPDVDRRTRPAATERRHDHAAVGLTSKASIERDRLIGEIAVGLEAAAQGIAFKRRVEHERQLARGDAAAAQAGAIGGGSQNPPP